MKYKIRPNFLIIGAAKAATSSLASMLESHPQAAIVQNKEPHFFSVDEFYRKGWKSYLSLYSHCRKELAIGDASTSYSRIRSHPLVVERIKKHLPKAKIIYMVRHPIERMESAYIEHLSTQSSIAATSINHAIRSIPAIVHSSRYWEVYQAYRSVFPEEQIQIVWFEEYVKNPLAVFQDVCRFLTIDDSYIPDASATQLNARSDALARMEAIGRGGVSVHMDWEEDLKRRVIDDLREDNLSFLAHFGRDANYWSDLY
jgi:hypothetical protein